MTAAAFVTLRSRNQGTVYLVEPKNLPAYPEEFYERVDGAAPEEAQSAESLYTLESSLAVSEASRAAIKETLRTVTGERDLARALLEEGRVRELRLRRDVGGLQEDITAAREALIREGMARNAADAELASAKLLMDEYCGDRDRLVARVHELDAELAKALGGLPSQLGELRGVLVEARASLQGLWVTGGESPRRAFAIDQIDRALRLCPIAHLDNLAGSPVVGTQENT